MINKQLTDLGRFLGTDAAAFVRIRKYYEDFVELAEDGSVEATIVLESLAATHTIITRIMERANAGLD